MDSYLQRPPSLPVLETTIGDYLLSRIRQYSQALAIVDDGAPCRWTYGELGEHIGRWREYLRRLDLRRGQRIALLGGNGAEWVAVFLACIFEGVVVVSLNPNLAADVILERMRMTGACLAFASAHSLESLKLRGARPVEESIPGMSLRAIELSIESRTVATNEQQGGTVHPRAACLICFSSGTTGVAKAITLTHRNLLNNAVLVGRALRYQPCQSVLSLFPFFVAGGLVIGVLAVLAQGAFIICPRSIKACGSIADTLNEYAPDYFLASPRVVEQVFDGSKRCPDFLAQVKCIGMGSTPCLPKFINTLLLEFKVPCVSLIYGMTETSPVTFMHAVTEPVAGDIAPVGYLIPNLEAKIVDDEGDIVPFGASGELCVRGHAVMAGYWGDPAATAATIDAAGWLKTGDLAHFGRDGACYVHGRKSEQYESEFGRIHPSLIERVFLKHRCVQNAQVVCLSDGRFIAWIKQERGSTVTPEQLADYYRAESKALPPISHIGLIDAYPLNDTGKVERAILVERAAIEWSSTNA